MMRAEERMARVILHIDTGYPLNRTTGSFLAVVSKRRGEDGPHRALLRTTRQFFGKQLPRPHDELKDVLAA